MSYPLTTIQNGADADNLFIKANSALQQTDVVNALTSTATHLPLAAAQGKILSDTMTNKFLSIDTLIGNIAIGRLFTLPGVLGGYWSSDQSYLFAESSGPITPVVAGSAVGSWLATVGPVAVQATTANKPIFRVTPESAIPWLDAMTEAAKLTATFDSALGSACTVIRVGPYGVVVEENVTIGTTYDITQPVKFNSDVLVINRALTEAEKIPILLYMQRRQPSLGPELLPNPNFDTDLSGWALTVPVDGSVTWEAGAVRMITASANVSAITSPSGSLPVNEPLHMTIDITSAASGNRLGLIPGSGRATPGFVAGIGTQSTMQTFSFLQVYRKFGSASNFLVNSISAKRIL